MKNTLKSSTITIKNIDLLKLKFQKSELLKIVHAVSSITEDKVKVTFEGRKGKKTETTLDISKLNGILHILDAIQDSAVEDLGFNENDIFEFAA